MLRLGPLAGRAGTWDKVATERLPRQPICSTIAIPTKSPEIRQHFPPVETAAKDISFSPLAHQLDEQCHALLIMGNRDFPSLSTAKAYNSLSKRQRAQKRVVENLEWSSSTSSADSPGSPGSSQLATRTERVINNSEAFDGASEDIALQHSEQTTQHPSPYDHDHAQPLHDRLPTPPGVASKPDQFANSFNSAKKAFNVDSPSFTPAQIQSGAKKSTFSSQTANATPFTPKGVTNCKCKDRMCYAGTVHAN